LVREKRQFFNFNWLPWQSPLKNEKKLNEVNKPLHLSTNPEILVKIGPFASETQVLESRPLKKQRKNIARIYSPVGKFAERAKLVKENYL